MVAENSGDLAEFIAHSHSQKPGPMANELLISDTEGKTQRLGSFAATCGRGDCVTVRLPNILASRHHCEVDVRHSQFVIRDLGSVNGTLVNGKPVAECVLHDGDEITIGACVLTVVSISATPASDRSASPAFTSRLRRLVGA